MWGGGGAVMKINRVCQARIRIGRLIAIAILILDVVGTIVAWHFTQEQELEIARDRFDAHVERANLAIRKRLLDHELVLRSGVGLFRSSARVERTEWRDFIANMRLEENFPGIQGVGFAEWVRPEEKAAHEASFRAKGFPKYRIWPEGDRPAYTSIIYLEPFVKRNLRAFGYDMWAEPVRNQAMSLSRDSGMVTISGKVKLVQETETDIQHGILMYVPFYRKDAPTETVEDRRAALVGFVYSPYRMKDLMRGILGDSIKDICLEIYDGRVSASGAPSAGVSDAGREIQEEAILFDAAPPLSLADTGARPLFRSTSHINAYGRDWTLHYYSLPAFDATLDRRQSIMVLAVGLLITLILGAHLAHEGRQTERFERLIAILDATPDIVAIATPEERILYVNRAGRVLLGIGENEDVSKLRIKEFHSREGYRQLTRTALPAIFQEGIWAGDMEFQSRAGRVIPTSMILIAHRNPSGGVDYFSTISRDLTDRRAAETRERALQQHLHQAEKMSALGTTIAGIAHELNNPLTGILGYAELVQNSQNLGECKADVAAIAKEAERCARIVKNLLTFARKGDPQRSLCDIHNHLENVLELCSAQMRLDSIEVQTLMCSDLPPIRVDCDMIQQVFLNLAQNAHHALKKTEGPRRLRVQTCKTDGRVRIVFQDSGPGIARENLKKIFDPFFTTKEVGQGTGLGLSVSYAIVAEHGGTIRAESEEGRGATITVELPDGLPPSDVEHRPERRVRDGENKASVLLVDDEASIRKTVSRYLGGRDFRVIAAGSVDEAIDALKTQVFDALIVDFKMPDKDGTVLYRHIARHHPELLESFLLSTGDVLSDEPRKFVEETGVRIVEKPYSMGHLAQVIRDVMVRRA